MAHYPLEDKTRSCHLHVAPGQSKGQITYRAGGLFVWYIWKSQCWKQQSTHDQACLNLGSKCCISFCAFGHAVSSAWSSLSIPFHLLPLPHNFQDISSPRRNPLLCALTAFSTVESKLMATLNPHHASQCSAQGRYSLDSGRKYEWVL